MDELRVVRLHWGVENNGHNSFDTVFVEDDKPWIEDCPQGALAVLLLRRIAYNLLVASARQPAERRRSSGRIAGGPDAANSRPSSRAVGILQKMDRSNLPCCAEHSTWTSGRARDAAGA
jgi:hypothetical protein